MHTQQSAINTLLTTPERHRFVVFGAGRAGASAARLLHHLSADVQIVDEGEQTAVEASLMKRGVTRDIPIQCGQVTQESFGNVDCVVLSPGVPNAHPAIQWARKNHVPIVNEVEVAAAHLPEARIVGITGTNGKSTTTMLLGAIFRAMSDSTFIGGNLGEPFCEAILNGNTPTLCALELSSYQLETISTLPLDVAVVTNLSPDHLDRYDSVDEYYAAKANIFNLLNPDGVLVLNQKDASLMHLKDRLAIKRSFNFNVNSDEAGVHVKNDELHIHHGGWDASIQVSNPHIIGAHNLQNAAAAIAAAVHVGVSESTCREGLNAYKGIAHRLERLGERQGVLWINDSKATNVDASLQALKSFREGVHLIVGGVGKGASYDPLVEAAEKCVSAVYAIGEEAPTIEKAFGQRFKVNVCQTLQNAVSRAMENAQSGDVILLSPACASFDQYRDYQARGNEFRQFYEYGTNQEGGQQ